MLPLLLSHVFAYTYSSAPSTALVAAHRFGGGVGRGCLLDERALVLRAMPVGRIASLTHTNTGKHPPHTHIERLLCTEIARVRAAYCLSAWRTESGSNLRQFGHERDSDATCMWRASASCQTVCLCVVCAFGAGAFCGVTGVNHVCLMGELDHIVIVANGSDNMLNYQPNAERSFTSSCLRHRYNTFVHVSSLWIISHTHFFHDVFFSNTHGNILCMNLNKLSHNIDFSVFVLWHRYGTTKQSGCNSNCCWTPGYQTNHTQCRHQWRRTRYMYNNDNTRHGFR